VELSPVKGDTTAAPWSTWIQNSVVTSATFSDRKSVTVVGTSVYKAGWSSTYEVPAATGRW
jgi:cellulase